MREKKGKEKEDEEEEKGREGMGGEEKAGVVPCAVISGGFNVDVDL